MEATDVRSDKASSRGLSAIARARNLRGSARKARLVLDLIRGRNVSDAKKILVFSNKRAALKVEKILDSAIATLIEKEGKAELENFFISKAYADDGPIMRRYMPRAQGRATIVRKRTCHITLGLSPLLSSEMKRRKNKRSGHGAELHHSDQTKVKSQTSKHKKKHEKSNEPTINKTGEGVI